MPASSGPRNGAALARTMLARTSSMDCMSKTAAPCRWLSPPTPWPAGGHRAAGRPAGPLTLSVKAPRTVLHRQNAIESEQPTSILPSGASSLPSSRNPGGKRTGQSRLRVERNAHFAEDAVDAELCLGFSARRRRWSRARRPGRRLPRSRAESACAVRGAKRASTANPAAMSGAVKVDIDAALRRRRRRDNAAARRKRGATEIGNRQLVDLQSAGVDLQPCAGRARQNRRRWRDRFRRQSSYRAAARRWSPPSPLCRNRARRRYRVRAH